MSCNPLRRSITSLIQGGPLADNIYTIDTSELIAILSRVYCYFTSCLLFAKAAMHDSVHLTVYLFPRQLFGRGRGDLKSGPPGLSCCFGGGPIMETGTYAAVVDPRSRFDQSMVYECDFAFDCFHPVAGWRWHCMGPLASIGGFIQTVLGMDKSVSFFDALTRGFYRTMHVLKAGPDLV